MKISRVAILKLIATEISRLESKADEEFTEAKKRYSAEHAAYYTNTADAWILFATGILQDPRVGDGLPRWEEVPEVLRANQYHKGLNFWDRNPPKRKDPDLNELNRMRSLIEIVADEFISTSDLIRLGFKIQFLFRS